MYERIKMNLCLCVFFIFSSCAQNLENENENETNSNVTKMQDLKVPSHFMFNVYQKSPSSIQILGPDGLPYKDGGALIFDQSKRFIQEAVTDQQGVIHLDVMLANSMDSFYVSPRAIGVPNDTIGFARGENGLIQSPIPIDYSFAPLARVFAAENSGNNGNSGNNNNPNKPIDLPQNLAENAVVSTSELEEINRAFPNNNGNSSKNPTLFGKNKPSDILIKDSADVWISFVHSKVGANNTLGFYTYTEGQSPASISALNKQVIFPNLGYRGKGGSMTSGMTVKIGRFGPNTRVGFFLVKNGWNGSSVDLSRTTYYSLSDFNPEADPTLRNHIAILNNPLSQRLVMGFEDQIKTTGGSQDYNDCMFLIRIGPTTSINTDEYLNIPDPVDSDLDGISDNNDVYPTDSERAYDVFYPAQNTFGTLAFEDMHPDTADYDFNDAVIRFNIKEVLDSQGKVKEILATLIPVASGATMANGFGFYFPNIANALDAIEMKIGKLLNSDQKLILSDNDIILRLIPNLPQVFKSVGVINTFEQYNNHKADTCTLKMVFKTSMDLEAAPYNPFIYRMDQLAQETHLIDKAPTPLYNSTLFGTKMDASVPLNKTFYRTSQGLPWAIVTSDQWLHPIERSDLVEAYPNFAEWVQSGGRLNRDWETQGRNMNKIYDK